MKKIIYFLILSFVATCAVEMAAQTNTPDDDESTYKPVRRHLRKRPAQIVVDATDSTTYYIEKSNDWVKRTNAQKKKLKEERPMRERAEHYEQLRAAVLGEDYEERQAQNERDKAYLDSLLAIDYTLEKLDFGPAPLKWIDEDRDEPLNELLQQNHVTSARAMPKNVEMGNRSNDVYFYFDYSQRGKPERLHLRMQYLADDPLHITQVRFLINGFFYDFNFSAVTQSGKHAPRLYWEVVDGEVNYTHKDLIYALSHCVWAHIIYVGNDGMRHRKKLTDKQISDFKSVFFLYQKQGGEL